MLTNGIASDHIKFSYENLKFSTSILCGIVNIQKILDAEFVGACVCDVSSQILIFMFPLFINHNIKPEARYTFCATICVVHSTDKVPQQKFYICIKIS